MPIGIPGYGNIGGASGVMSPDWQQQMQRQLQANQQAVSAPGYMQALGPQNSIGQNNALASAQQGLVPQTTAPAGSAAYQPMQAPRGGSPTMPNTGTQMYGQQAQMQQAPQRQQVQNQAQQAGGVSGPPPAPTASQQVPPSQGGATVGQGAQQPPSALTDLQNRLQGPQQGPSGMSQNQLISRAQGMQTGVF